MSNPFKNWTQADVERFNARRKPTRAEAAHNAYMNAVLDEKKLHCDILNQCEQRGWIALHGSTAHRTFRTVGEFDFTILADRGRVFLIECKARSGKLTEEQQAMQHWARKLEHNPLVVRSLEEFLQVIR